MRYQRVALIFLRAMELNSWDGMSRKSWEKMTIGDDFSKFDIDFRCEVII